MPVPVHLVFWEINSGLQEFWQTNVSNIIRIWPLHWRMYMYTSTYCQSSVCQPLLNAKLPILAGWLLCCTKVNVGSPMHAGSPLHARVMQGRHGKCFKCLLVCYDVSWVLVLCHCNKASSHECGRKTLKEAVARQSKADTTDFMVLHM